MLTVALVATAIYETVEFFLDVFGSSHPMVPRQLLHEIHPPYLDIIRVPFGLIPGENSAASFLAKSDDAPEPGVVLARAIAVPFSRLPENVNEPPGNGFTQKRGPNYVNPDTGQSLHPDPDHQGAMGPHYDLHSGDNEPKGKVRLRQFGDQLQYWVDELQQYIEIEGPTFLPVE